MCNGYYMFTFPSALIFTIKTSSKPFQLQLVLFPVLCQVYSVLIFYGATHYFIYSALVWEEDLTLVTLSDPVPLFFFHNSYLPWWKFIQPTWWNSFGLVPLWLWLLLRKCLWLCLEYPKPSQEKLYYPINEPTPHSLPQSLCFTQKPLTRGGKSSSNEGGFKRQDRLTH